MTFKLDGTHVMIDLETLGNSNNAVIVAIGAVAFTQTEMLTTIYKVVDPESCVKAGLSMDTSTVMWWLKQSPEARDAVCQPGVNLMQALNELSVWYPKGACLWGNGATFDNVILDNAYKAINVKPPWKYTAHRCYRTIKNLFPVEQPSFQGIPHNALFDAVHQAKHLVAIANQA